MAKMPRRSSFAVAVYITYGEYDRTLQIGRRGDGALGHAPGSRRGRGLRVQKTNKQSVHTFNGAKVAIEGEERWFSSVQFILEIRKQIKKNNNGLAQKQA